MTDRDYINLMALVLVLLPIVDWAATGVLFYSVLRFPKGASLMDRYQATPRAQRERAWTALAISMGATSGAVVALAFFIGRSLGPLYGPLGITIAVAAGSIANAAWLWRFLTHGFQDEEEA